MVRLAPVPIAATADHESLALGDYVVAAQTTELLQRHTRSWCRLIADTRARCVAVAAGFSAMNWASVDAVAGSAGRSAPWHQSANNAQSY